MEVHMLVLGLEQLPLTDFVEDVARGRLEELVIDDNMACDRPSNAWW